MWCITWQTFSRTKSFDSSALSVNVLNIILLLRWMLVYIIYNIIDTNYDATRKSRKSVHEIALLLLLSLYDAIRVPSGFVFIWMYTYMLLLHIYIYISYGEILYNNNNNIIYYYRSMVIGLSPTREHNNIIIPISFVFYVDSSEISIFQFRVSTTFPFTVADRESRRPWCAGSCGWRAAVLR